MDRTAPLKPSYEGKTINSTRLASLVAQLEHLELYDDNDDPEELDRTKKQIAREWFNCVNELLTQFLNRVQCRSCSVQPKDLSEVLAHPHQFHPLLPEILRYLRNLSWTPDRLFHGIGPDDTVWESLFDIGCALVISHLDPGATFDSEGKVVTPDLPERFINRTPLEHHFAGCHPQIREAKAQFLAQATRRPPILQPPIPTQPPAPAMATLGERPTGGQSSDESTNRRAPESVSAKPPSERQSRNQSPTGSIDRGPGPTPQPPPTTPHQIQETPTTRPPPSHVSRPSMQFTLHQSQKSSPTAQPPHKVARLGNGSSPHQAQKSNPISPMSPGSDTQPTSAEQRHRRTRTETGAGGGHMDTWYQRFREYRATKMKIPTYTRPTDGIYAPALRYCDYKKSQSASASAPQNEPASGEPLTSQATGPRKKHPGQAVEATKTPRQQAKRTMPPANPQISSDSPARGFASQPPLAQRRPSERPNRDSKGKEATTKGQTSNTRERVWERVGMTESSYDEYKDWVKQNHTWAEMNHIMAKNLKEQKKRTRKALLEDERFHLAAREIVDGFIAEQKAAEAVSETLGSRPDSTTTPVNSNASEPARNPLEGAVGFDHQGNLMRRDDTAARPARQLPPTPRELVLDGPNGPRGFDMDGNLVGVDKSLYPRADGNQD